MAAAAGEGGGKDDLDICQVCQQVRAKYTCPKCNARYCQLECYRGHSAGCVDAFYRENVIQELQQNHATDESRQKVCEILKRVHLDDEEEASDELQQDKHSIFSDETIESLRLQVQQGEALDISSEWPISQEEYEAFKRAAHRGELSHLVTQWEPWWTQSGVCELRCAADGTALIAEVGPSRAEGEGAPSVRMDGMPDLPASPIRALKTLTKKEPSPQLRWHLADILYSYCYITRVHNGDVHEDPFIIYYYIDVSTVLSSTAAGDKNRKLPETIRDAAVGSMENARRSAALLRLDTPHAFQVSALKDASLVLACGKAAVLCALWGMLGFAKSALAIPKRDLNKSSALSKSGMRAVKLKLEFFLSWVNGMDVAVLDDLSSSMLCVYEDFANVQH